MIVSKKKEDRGLTPVVGVFLLLAIGVVLLGMYFTIILPNLTEIAEYNSYNSIDTDMAELNDKTKSVQADGISRSHIIDLQTEYPPGQLVGNRTQKLTLTEADTVVNVGTDTTYSYNSGIITYKPNFNQYRPSELFIERGIKVTDSDTQTLSFESQSVVDGSTITITEITGDIDRGSATNIEVSLSQEEAFSSYTVSNDIELELYTHISEEKWNDLLEDELDENGGNISSIDYQENSNLNKIEIELQSDTYTIQTGEVKIR